MSTPNRAALFGKIQKVLKKTYKYTPTKDDRPLLESLLFACCLENAPHDKAVAGLEKVRTSFFDWNEIRVSTVKELTEVLHDLPDAAGAASRLKGVLQSVFESDYSFELEHLKKQNIGVAVKRLQKLQGSTGFNVAYATQHSLGGHSIPVDKGTLGALFVLGAISQSEADHGSVPGMERAISKSKGQEFAALLHELGADFFANPFSPTLRELLLSISSDAKDRFPKRVTKKAAPEPPPAPPAKVVDTKKKDKEVAKKPAAPEKAAPKRAAAPAKPAAPAKKKPVPVKRAPAKPLAKRKPR